MCIHTYVYIKSQEYIFISIRTFAQNEIVSIFIQAHVNILCYLLTSFTKFELQNIRKNFHFDFSCICRFATESCLPLYLCEDIAVAQRVLQEVY